MCLDYDMGIMTWSPLAQGVLAGRYKSADDLPRGSRATQKSIYRERVTKEGIKIAQKVLNWAKEKELSPTALSVSWILHQPAITSVIIGPRTPEHLDDLVSAQDIHLLTEDLAWLNTLVPSGTYVSDHFNTAGWRRPIQNGDNNYC
jgi:aryl-alcohol dehydrogenase-like predicted oxidoreductase